MSARALGVLLVLALTGCRERGLNALATELSVPETLEFGTVFAGFARTRALEVTNRGRAAVEFTTSSAVPFTAPTSLRVAGGSTATLDVELLGHEVGPVTGSLHLEAEGLSYEVQLSGEVQVAPVCVPANDCVEAHFDPEAGCVETPAAEGARCGANDRCLVDGHGHCQRGACLGERVNCDDGDACTTDACSPSRGCFHPPVQCAEPSGVCEAAVCLPATGCAIVPAVDGARCGSNDCATAHVCIAGACEERPAPDGSECGAPSACRAAGHCAAGTCTPSPPTVPAPLWRFTPPPTMNLMRAVVDTQGNTFALVGTDVVIPEDGGPPPPYALWLTSFDRNGSQLFSVNLTRETAGLENGVALMVDPEARVVYLAARTYNYGTSTPVRVVVAQARSATTGALLWERDLRTNIAISNSGDGRLHLEVTRMMLLSPQVLSFAMVEGDSLHVAYVIGLSTQTGAELWRTQRGGHLSAGASGNGHVWEGSAACWSSEHFVSHISASGVSSSRSLLSVSMIAFGEDRALVRTSPGAQLAWMSPSLSLTPVALRPQRTLSWNAFARLEGPMLTLVTESTLSLPSLDRLDTSSGVWQWSAPLGEGSISQVWLLRDGGTATNLTLGDGGTELVTHAGDGREVERCPYGGARGISVSNGLYLTWDGPSLTAFSVPGREAATSGWSGPDGYAGTGRY
jgi:hypothetical protein